MRIHLLLFLFLPVGLPAQGLFDGFMKGKGSWDIALSYARENYNQYYFGSALTDQQNQIQTYSLYATGGISPNLDLVVALPYVRTDEQNSNFQDASLGFKYLNRKIDGLNVITAAAVSFPVSGYSPTTNNPIGQRAGVFSGRLIMQQFGKSGVFFQGQSGLDFRFAPSSLFGFPFILRAGWASRYIYFDAFFDGFWTVGGGTDQTIGAGEGSDWIKLGGTLFVPAGRRLGFFGGVAHYLSGRNIGKGTRWNAGLVVRFTPNPARRNSSAIP